MGLPLSPNQPGVDGPALRSRAAPATWRRREGYGAGDPPWFWSFVAGPAPDAGRLSRAPAPDGAPLSTNHRRRRPGVKATTGSRPGPYLHPISGCGRSLATPIAARPPASSPPALASAPNTNVPAKPLGSAADPGPPAYPLLSRARAGEGSHAPALVGSCRPPADNGRTRDLGRRRWGTGRQQM